MYLVTLQKSFMLCHLFCKPKMGLTQNGTYFSIINDNQLKYIICCSEQSVCKHVQLKWNKIQL